ncbi:MAG: mercuric transporter MerT family protein [Acidobacteriota bacterium]
MKDKVVSTSAIVTAIASSLCCTGPLLAAVLGLGAFGGASAFEALRPYLLVVTGVMLAIAFYLTYRKREVTCEDGACRRQGASRASKIMLWLVTVAAAAFAAFPYYSGALLKADAKSGAKPVVSQDSNMKEVVIDVEGMTCGSCATAVRLALAGVEGVASAEVSYENKKAKVTYDPAIAQPDQMKVAIDKTGFKATGTRITNE